jgi:hypothetical protein
MALYIRTYIHTYIYIYTHRLQKLERAARDVGMAGKWRHNKPQRSKQQSDDGIRGMRGGGGDEDAEHGQTLFAIPYISKDHKAAVTPREVFCLKHTCAHHMGDAMHMPLRGGATIMRTLDDYRRAPPTIYTHHINMHMSLRGGATMMRTLDDFRPALPMMYIHHINLHMSLRGGATMMRTLDDYRPAPSAPKPSAKRSDLVMLGGRLYPVQHGRRNRKNVLEMEKEMEMGGASDVVREWRICVHCGM